MPHKIFKSKGLCDFNVFIRRKNWIRVQGQIYFNQGPRLPLGMHNSYQEDLHSFLLYQYNWLHPLSNIRSIIDLLFELSGSFSYRIPTWKYPGEETSAVGHLHHTAGWLWRWRRKSVPWSFITEYHSKVWVMPARTHSLMLPAAPGRSLIHH